MTQRNADKSDGRQFRAKAKLQNSEFGPQMTQRNADKSDGRQFRAKAKLQNSEFGPQMTQRNADKSDGRQTERARAGTADGCGRPSFIGSLLVGEAPMVSAAVPRDRLTHRGRSQTSSCRSCVVAGSTDLSEWKRFLHDEETRDPRTYAIIGAAIEVHRRLGCGFSEPVYQDALEVEFLHRGIPFQRELELRIAYREQILRSFYKADFVCYGSIVVELKSLAGLDSAHIAQVINYLKATGHTAGLLLNFGTSRLECRRLIFSGPTSEVLDETVYSRPADDLSEC